MELETRFITTEIRLVGDNQRTIRGTIPYNTLSVDLGGFREQLAPGVFGDSLAGDIRSFWNHNTKGFPLGRTAANTMRLADTENGLDFEVDLPDTSDGRDLRESLLNRNVDGVSFGFYTPIDGSGEVWTNSNGVIRTVTNAELVEISPVNYPAYPSASVALRSLEKWKEQEQREQEPQRNYKSWLDLMGLKYR